MPHDATAPTQINEQDRRLLATAIFRLFDHWKLSESEQCSLLGLDHEHASRLIEMRESGLLIPSAEIAERARALLRVYRFLGMLFAQNDDLARQWMMTRTARLNGESPFERIEKGGAAGLRSVANLLEEQVF